MQTNSTEFFDRANLEALLVERDALLAERNARIAQLEQENKDLKHNVEVYRQLAFGPSSEKRRPKHQTPSTSPQGYLFLAELVEEAERVADETLATGTVELVPGKSSEQADTKSKSKRGRRSKLPAHLPSVKTTFELSPSERTCNCGKVMDPIGEETSKRIERIETCVEHVIARKKYACKKCQTGVLTAPLSPQPIAKGLLGPGMLAHVIVERFGNHLPYNRLEKQYKSEGLELSRVVLSESMAKVAELLEPIWEVLGEEVVGTDVIFTDDTPTLMLDSSQGVKKQGTMWVYLDLDGRHYFVFSECHSKKEPARVLAKYKAWIHADGYKGYGDLFVPDGATHVACWAHARRYFTKALVTDKELAEEILGLIRELYMLERCFNTLDPEARAKARKQQSGAVLKKIHAWLSVTEAKCLPKSPLGRAVRYALAHWKALTRFPLDGRLRLDNNLAENALRPFAVGRNYVESSVMLSSPRRARGRATWTRDELRIITGHRGRPATCRRACSAPRLPSVPRRVPAHALSWRDPPPGRHEWSRDSRVPSRGRSR